MKTAPALNSRWCKISAIYSTSSGGSDVKRATCLRICSFMNSLFSGELNGKRVDAIAPLVFHAPRQAPNKADAQPAGLAVLEALLEVGLRNLTGVEGMSVVEDLQTKAVCQAFDAERDLMFQFIVVAILDDVGAEFLCRQLGLVKRLRSA